MLIQKIQERVQILSAEAHKLHGDKKTLEKRIADIDIRMHQIVGALHELQTLQAVSVEVKSEPAKEETQEGINP